MICHTSGRLWPRHVRCKGKQQHYGGQPALLYSSCCHCWLFPAVPRGFAGIIAGNRHYSAGAIGGHLPHFIFGLGGDVVSTGSRDGPEEEPQAKES